MFIFPQCKIVSRTNFIKTY